MMQIENHDISESAVALSKSKSIGLYKLKTLLSLLPLLYRFSEDYSESLHLHSRDKNVQISKIHSLTYEKKTTTSNIDFCSVSLDQRTDLLSYNLLAAAMTLKLLRSTLALLPGMPFAIC